MSCGDPHETPCSEVLEAVYLYLDGEQDATPPRQGPHPPRRVRALPAAVRPRAGRQVAASPAPAAATRRRSDLRDRVLLRIQQVRVEIDHVEYRAE